MKADYRQAVQGFLRDHEVKTLGSPDVSRKDGMQKAAIIPFHLFGAQRYYLVMQPEAQKLHLPPPALQICKGTRMMRMASGWRDVSDDAYEAIELENLEVTALREGREEIGLEVDNIQELYELGYAAFASASTGKPKAMWVYATWVRDRHHFSAPDEELSKTHKCQWVTLDEFMDIGREDHRDPLKMLDIALNNLAF